MQDLKLQDTFKIHPRSKSTQSNSKTAYRSRVRVRLGVIMIVRNNLKKYLKKSKYISNKLINKENINKNQVDFERGWILIVYQ